MIDSKGCFITGTDTGVGKTYIAARLIRGLQNLGISVRPRKPVESGCSLEDGCLVPEDALLLSNTAGNLEPLDRVCPYRFAAPISPERAARMERRSLSLQDLVAACQIHAQHFLLVEGAGGFHSPIASNSLNADLAQALGLPIIIVAADRLGTINQVLLTAEAVINRHLDLLAVILNQIEPGTTTGDMNNAEDLQIWLNNVPIIQTPYGNGTISAESLEVIRPLLERLTVLN